jgi:hypothetical protein
VEAVVPGTKKLGLNWTGVALTIRGAPARGSLGHSVCVFTRRAPTRRPAFLFLGPRGYSSLAQELPRGNFKVRTGRLVSLTLLVTSALACGCASAPANHASTAKTPAAAPASAAAPATPATTGAIASSASTAASTDDPNKVICHNEVPTGSRVALRVCETAAQRAARKASTEAIRDSLTRPASGGCPQLGPGGCAGGG